MMAAAERKKQINVLMDDDLLKALNEYRMRVYRERNLADIPTMTEVVKELLSKGLTLQGFPPEPA